MKVKAFKQRIKYQGGCDRRINQWQIIDIHEIPTLMLEHHEIDFYCCNNEMVILLRIRNRKQERYDIVDSSTSCSFWIAELPVTRVNDALLQKVLLNFEGLLS